MRFNILGRKTLKPGRFHYETFEFHNETFWRNYIMPLFSIMAFTFDNK